MKIKGDLIIRKGSKITVNGEEVEPKEFGEKLKREGKLGGDVIVEEEETRE